ncbi:MAG: clostripain-related cysteine peptidase [Promethearchaeota archaeon]
MAADNDQEIAAVDNIKEMELVGSTEQVNILVYVDFLTNNTSFGPGAYTFNITKDELPLNNTIVSEPLNTTLPDEPNMGDPATLLGFIEFGQNYSQAANYLLILWDKGGGYKGVCYDDTSGGDRLLLQEIAIVLENDTLEPITLTAFDASFMGQIELAYEIKEGTELIVFSEEAVPNQHFPYHIIFNSLISHEDSSSYLLAKEIVDRYVEAYSPLGTYYNPVSPQTRLCLSVVNTTLVGDVFDWFNRTTTWLTTGYNTLTHYQEISAARGLTQQFNLPSYIDLGGFAYQLSQLIENITFTHYTGNLSLSVQTAVSYHRALSGLPGASGLAMNFNSYESVSLALLDNSVYEDFLSTFLSLGETTGTSIISLTLGPIRGYLDGKDDSVFYRFTSQIAIEHTITLSAFQPTDDDFDLYLYDSNLNLLTRSVGLTSDETIQWVLIPGRLYYIRVHSSPRTDITYGLGSFELLITPSSPINPALVALHIGIIVAIICLFILVLYIIWRNRERITRAIERYRVRRMARQLQSEASTATTPSTGTPGACVKCGEQLPEEARFCPNCGETFEESSDDREG